MTNMNDVAKAAGVSKSTVSNVFSGKRPISSLVTERVLTVARELNYRPNYFARSMVTKETGNIGIVMNSEKALFNQYNISFFNGVLKECHRQGYRLLVDTLSEETRRQVPYMTSEPIDGAIILDPAVEDKRVNDRIEAGVRMVILGSPPPKYESRLSFVDNDNTKAAETATTYLLSLGHENILFINAAKERTVSRDRSRGYAEGLKRYGKTADERLIIYRDASVHSVEFGYRIGKEFLGGTRSITAVIADTDQIALGVYRAAAELGRSIPSDLSVIAFNNETVYPKEFDPPLTSVELSGERLGQEAAKLLIDQTKAKEATVKQIIIQSTLNIRASCGPVLTVR